MGIDGAAADGLVCLHSPRCLQGDPAATCAANEIALDRGLDLAIDGGTCLRLWVVLSGLVALTTTLSDGRRQIVDLSTPGDVICPFSTADEGVNAIAALAPSRLCENDLSAYARNDPAFAAELFRLAHRKLERSAAHLVLLGRLDGMERVCFFLADMARRIGARHEDSWWVELPLNREDIADYLGLNSETVSRLFSRIKKAKLVTFLSPTRYVVHDMDRLQARAPIGAPWSSDDIGEELRQRVAGSLGRPL